MPVSTNGGSRQTQGPELDKEIQIYEREGLVVPRNYEISHPEKKGLFLPSQGLAVTGRSALLYKIQKINKPT